MGNRPTPASLRQLSGSNLHRINPREAKFRSVDSVKPLKDVAKDEYAMEIWNDLLPELIHVGTLKKANLRCFGDICIAGGMATRFLKDIQENGIMLEQPVFNKAGELTGHRRIVNPAVSQAQKHRLEMLRHCTEFGITPAAATRVVADPPDDSVPRSIDDLDNEEQDGATIQ